MKDPLAGSSWSEAGTVAGFAQSPPNQTLLAFAAAERRRGSSRLLDIGCGAGRNAIPLAEQGWSVTGTDLSWPMLCAARQRTAPPPETGSLQLTLAPMEALPFVSGCMDCIVAHGIWNLARTTAQFRAALDEAARVARDEAALFVFTFSRSTLPQEDVPVPGEHYVYTGFSGAPQIFLTMDQLEEELARVGFRLDASVPYVEHNRRPPGLQQRGGPPVIIEGSFRFHGNG